jgi:hypothetical protein
METLAQKILTDVFLPVFNIGVAAIICGLLVLFAKYAFQAFMGKGKSDKYRTAEVFSILKSVGLPVRKKPILTMREQPMYGQLIRAFPNHVILAQVSFQALLDTDDRGVRNRFDRKYADFVICTKAFNAVGIVELDDSTHNGREREDAERDSFLIAAGYPVFRYKTIPDLPKLRQDITPDAATFGEPSPVANIETA